MEVIGNCYKCNKEVVRKLKCKKYICDECRKNKIRGQQKEWYQENKEDILKRQKEYQERPEVKERQKEYQKKYYQENKEDIREKRKEYHSRPEIRQRRNERQKERKRTDIEFNIICRLRNRTRAILNKYLKGKAKPQTTVEYLGCSIEYFKEYFERKFTKGMNWKKYLEGNIHIDHRIPCSWFDLNMESEREECFHYTNLQPLWAKDNLKKGAKLPTK